MERPAIADSARLLPDKVVPACTALIQSAVVATAAQFELSSVITVSWTCAADADPVAFDSGMAPVASDSTSTAEAERLRSSSGREDAVVRHVAGEGDRVDALGAQPLEQAGSLEDAGETLGHPLRRGIRTLLDLGVQAVSVGPDSEDRRALRKLMLHDDDRHIAARRDVERLDDLGDGLVARRVLDGQQPVEVLLLCVDDDQCSARRTHGMPLSIRRKRPAPA